MAKLLKGIKINQIGYGGVGLARRQDGKRIIIKGGALPGTVVDLRIIKEKKDYLEAHIIQIIKTNPAIIDSEPFCAHFFSLLQNQDLQPETGNLQLLTKVGCGGCKRQVLSYRNQLKLKEDIVLEAFAQIQKADPNIQFLPILGSPEPKGYRNKIEFSFGKYITNKKVERSKEQGTIPQNCGTVTFILEPVTLSGRSLGFHKQGEFSKIIDIDNCGLISDQANKIFDYIKNILIKSKLPVYDQKTHQGFFRHLAIREGTNTGQILVNLSVADKNLKENTAKWDKLLEKIKKDKFLNDSIQTFVITYNNGLGDTIHNDQSITKTFRGNGHIFEKLLFNNESQEPTTNDQGLMTVSFRISPFSFFQTNTLGAQQLFAQAFKLIGNIEGTILDLYCGTGSIGISLLHLSKGNKLVGIEISQEAITDARYNAKINGLEDQVTFLAAPAEKAFATNPDLRDKIKNLGLVVIDPPRDGLHTNTIKLLSDLRKEHSFKLLYISCNPITMKRDIELLIKDGFKLKIIQPVDMFPQTHHIETIGILQ